MNKSQKTDLKENDKKIMAFLKHQKLKNDLQIGKRKLGHVTKSWLVIGQNSLTGQCGSNTQRIYKLIIRPNAQKVSDLDNIFLAQ